MGIAGSASRRIRPIGVNAIFQDRLSHAPRWQKLVIGERLQARDDDMIAVDLEKRSQAPAMGGAPEAVFAENLAAGGHVTTHARPERLPAVGDCNDPPRYPP